jgi:hypothetical protein
MRTVSSIAIVVAAIVVFVIAGGFFLPKLLVAQIEYRGESIKLSRYYVSYDDYKDDPNNIASSERERVKRLVTTAPMPQHYTSPDAVMTAMRDVTFPGYGSGGFGDVALVQRPPLVGFCVEVPLADEQRCFTFERDNDGYRLADDFLLDTGLLRTVHKDSTGFTYVRFDGSVFHRPPQASPYQ